MAAKQIICVFLLCQIIYVISQQIGSDEQCVESEAFGVSKLPGAKGYLPDDQITASSSTNKREGFKGRLFHDSVWQAASNNYNQYLQVNLGRRRLITRVATQGYRGSGQYVMDYHISYSNDESTFTPVVNELGERKVFPGNTHDDKPQFNTFEYPIVAQYVRFIPLRWTINIAMRVELYGCDYDGKAAYFDGFSRISFNAHVPNTLYTTTDVLRFRMKTNQDEGLLFYASGNQGDYICMELYRGRLYAALNLGSIDGSDSSVRGVVGSLLDDNQWHDVEFLRQDKNVTVSVDRVPINITVHGEYSRLDLDRYLYVGGVNTFYQSGITVRKNFIGCVENFVWNGIHMTRDKDLPRFSVVGQVEDTCRTGTYAMPLTFPSTSSYMTISDASSIKDNLHIKLEFRAYDNDKLLVSTKLTDSGYFYLRISPDGYIEFELKPSTNKYIIKEIAKGDKGDGSYTDGLWHQLDFHATANKITLVIDDKTFITSRILTFTTSSKFSVGGGETDQSGFVGCLRNVFIQFESLEEGAIMCSRASCYGVLEDTCQMEDRCSPNPCEHNTQCQQTFGTFTCTCGNSGYVGATCHQSMHPNSCSRVFELVEDSGIIEETIDIDGAGALEPFPVKCFKNPDNNLVETWLSHDFTHEVLVDGFQPAGSYHQVITYDANLTQIDQLVHRAAKCRQEIKYRCEGSRLLAKPGGSGTGGGGNTNDDGTGPEQDQVVLAFGWWVGRNIQNNYYWGGSAPGTHKCACGLEGNCQGQEPTCNCDAALSEQGISDSGFLEHKNHLPVLELRFGDTGALFDSRRGWHTLGELICTGDRLFDQPVTFRKTDSIVFFDTFWSRELSDLNTWDISFRFKTTAENGVMVYRTGDVDFVEVKLVTSTSMSFRFSAGYGVQAVTVETAFELNDDDWHNVYAERNRKEALLQIDQFSPVRVAHPLGVGYLPFNFNKPLIVGATADYKDGFVGCMSSLQYNGETLDLYDKVANDPRFSYGMSKGCVGKCAVNPCLNGGICKEKYSEFLCDCSYTPFRGLICGREVGTSIYDGQMLIYEPISTLKTVSENITIGFFTRKKGGVILQLTDALYNPTEYMVVELTSGGGIRVHFKFGEERLQINSKVGLSIEFANAQPHVVNFQRLNGGKTFRLQVDDYPVQDENWKDFFPDGADVYLENIKYILLGRNTSDETSFVGCIFRAEFDNHWPLKRIFQEPRPSFVNVTPSFDSVREERCGFEEILPDAEPAEIRPTYEPPVKIFDDDVDPATTSQGISAAYLGAIFGAVGIILILVLSVVIYKCRHVGEYPDSEEDELEMLDASPDGKQEEYDGTYHPKSMRERYESKSQPSDQAFI